MLRLALSLLLFLSGASVQLHADTANRSVIRQSLYVPVRDGTRLAMNVYRPAEDGKPLAGPFPVVFTFTPYRARYRNEEGEVVELRQMRSFGVDDLTAHGYVLAVADIRGKGASFGARRGFLDRTEARDGHDLVQWLASRPWSDGNVGMLGCSYPGGATMAVASTRPPALKAIFTGATDFDKFSFVRRGGITAQFNTRPDEPLEVDLASVPVDGDESGVLLREAVSEHAGNTPMAPLWYGMPFRDSVSTFTGTRFWEEVGPYSYLEELKDPGIARYFWSNWYDEPTEQMIQAAANLGGKLLIGPGSHCVPPPNFDLGGEIKRFFDQHLKGMKTGLEEEPLYRYWVENLPSDDPWISSDTLPGARVDRTDWYLQASALSTQSPAAVSRQSFKVDYDISDPEYFSFWVESQQAHGPMFTSEVFDRDQLLVGSSVADLLISSDREDVNIFAYLEDIDPSGKAKVVSFGRLAAGYRKLREAPYDTLGVPWVSGRESDYEPLPKNESVRLRFGLTPNAHVFRRGHRMRFVVTGADPRQRNLEQIRQHPAPRIDLHFGAGQGSRLEIPVRALQP